MFPDALSDTILDETASRFPHFLRESIRIEPLEKGGSDRKYYRIDMRGEGSLILVKYGDQREENRHYCEIDAFLESLEVRVPSIYHHDTDAGLIWMEDLGAIDLWHYRNHPWPVRQALYRDALEQVLRLHTRGHLALENGELASPHPKFQNGFDAELYRWEQGYFFENCAGRYFGVEPARIEQGSDERKLHAIAERLAAIPRVLVHRDFQSQNIMVLDRRAYLIDFQGMRPGLAQYDLASLLYDPYVTLSPEERESLVADYIVLCAEAGFSVPADFREIYDLCAMQRLMQALGAYGFLGLVKERAHFLEHIPAALASLKEVVARIPGLENLGKLIGGFAGLGQRQDSQD